MLEAISVREVWTMGSYHENLHIQLVLFQFTVSWFNVYSYCNYKFLVFALLLCTIFHEEVRQICTLEKRIKVLAIELKIST